MARVLAVQSREIWQVATGSLSDQLEPSRPIRPHVLVKKMSGGLRMSFRILLTTRTDCLCCLQLRTLLLCVCGPLLCMFGHDVCMYALCVCSVYVHQRYNSNRRATLCGTLVLTLHKYAYMWCVLWHVNMCVPLLHTTAVLDGCLGFDLRL